MDSDPARRTPRTPWLEVALAALPAALHALILMGRLHPDEVFQSLEIALHRTYGFGIVPWEWFAPPQVPADRPWGIRNWAVPLVFSMFLKLGDALGISAPMGRRVLLELPQFALHVAMLGAVWRLTFRRAGVQGARAALWLVALYGPLVWFAGRTMSEAFSTAFLVWGLERLDSRGAKPGWWVLGGALLGLAQVTRYGSAAAIVPAMVWLLLERRWKTFALATTGGALIALGLGLLDKLTWGEWFHSLLHYFQYNVTSGAAAQAFGAAPWWSYVPRLLLAPFAFIGLGLSVRRDRTTRWAGLALLVLSVLAGVLLWQSQRFASLQPMTPWLGAGALLALAWLLLRDDVEQPSVLIASALGYLAILSATAHKEDRFVYPALVLLTVAAAPTFVKWVRDGGPPRRAVGGLLAAAGVAFFLFPSPFDVQRKEQFQLVARDAPRTTGLVIMNEGMWGSPGFFYLGKNIPWCPCDFPHDQCFQVAARDPRFNRGLFWLNSTAEAEAERGRQAEAAFLAAGFRVAERRGLATWFVRGD